MNAPDRRWNPWLIAAVLAWAAALLGLLAHRTGIFSHHPALARTTLDVYRLAGERWLQGEFLYADRRGFVYGPLYAALFTPFTWLPQRLGAALWIALNTAALLGGFMALLRSGIFPRFDARQQGAALLLLLPLALGNLDVLQANPLVMGLLLAAYAAAWGERWAVAALCVALATHCKIYPLAAGMLLFLFAPSRFGWRLALAVVLLGLLPFLFQHWGYVHDQYHAWLVTRTSDNRLQYSDKDAPLDLYYLLARLGGITVPPLLYRAVQALAGCGIAVYQLLAWRARRPREQIYAGSFVLLSIWMTLFGPATESYTYILLAPAAAIVFTQAFFERNPAPLRVLISLAVGLLLFAVVRNSFIPHLRNPWAQAAQPLGAAVLLLATLFWLFSNDQTKRTSTPASA